MSPRSCQPACLPASVARRPSKKSGHQLIASLCAATPLQSRMTFLQQVLHFGGRNKLTPRKLRVQGKATRPAPCSTCGQQRPAAPSGWWLVLFTSARGKGPPSKQHMPLRGMTVMRHISMAWAAVALLCVEATRLLAGGLELALLSSSCSQCRPTEPKAQVASDFRRAFCEAFQWSPHMRGLFVKRRSSAAWAVKAALECRSHAGKLASLQKGELPH